MTTAFPGSGDDQGDGERRPVDDDEISRRFTEIVAGLSEQLDWDPDAEPEPVEPADEGDRATGTQPRGDRWAPQQPVDNAAERRRLRRELRRAERAEEVAAFAEEQARREAEYAADSEHFVPPEPPPLRRPRLRTVVAVLLVVAGLFLMLGPNVLAISPNGTLMLSVLLLLAGAGMLVAGIRSRHEPGEGWDDGSRV